MKCLWQFVLVVTILLPLTGCAHDPATSQIPWWKGMPAQVFAPNSQEAFGWRKQRHGHTYEQEIYPWGGSFAPAAPPGEPTPAGPETEYVAPPQPE